MSKFFITRPVATIVLMLLIVLFGYLNLRRLPVSEYPNIEIPTIAITTTYEGASSDIVETKITQTIENAVAGVEGLDNIQSTTKQGRSTVQLEFSIGRDLDAAANDVRDRINRVLNKLPEDATIPIVRKFDSSGMPVMIIAVTNPNMTRIELSDYTYRYLVDRFSVLEGVASVEITGQQEQAMRIRLNRKEMSSHGVTASDVENALNTENVEYPAGRIESKDKEFPITLNRQYNTVEDFKRLIVSKDENGNSTRISDIARVDIGSKSQRNYFKANHEPMVSMGILKQATANSVVISTGAKKLIRELQSTMPKGMKLYALKDEAEFIEESISEVFWTMIIAAFLVFWIIFIFIGSCKAALIPIITVPISIIGSCIVLSTLNYSINMLTLLAMVLSIGIVVDDAILVVENIQRRLDDGETSFEAAINGSSQVQFAVISTTAVLLAVFLPIGMLPGKTGKLFNEFSVTVSAAVCFSGVIALTLTPMLCGLFLSNRKQSRLNELVNNVVVRARALYEGWLGVLIGRQAVVLAIFLGVLCTTAWFIAYIPGEYEPVEDRNSVLVKVEAQEGTGIYAMNNYVEEVLKKVYLLEEQKLTRNILAAIPGLNSSLAGEVNRAIILIELKSQNERSLHAEQIAGRLRRKLAEIPGVKSSPVLPVGIGTKGSHPLQFVIGGYDYNELIKWKNIIFEEAEKFPGIMDIECDYKETSPKFRVDIDKDRAGDLGVSAKTIGSTLEIMLGSKSVTTFADRGKEYDVILQADMGSRDNLNDISNICVKSQTSPSLVPLDNVISIKELGEASKLGRQNRSRSITISGNVGNGYTLGEALAYLEKVVREKLPSYAQIYYRGQSKDYKESEGGVLLVFILAILVSYFILAAQFESFFSPFIVMLTIPLGLFGAVFSLWVVGYTMNIYTQIGLIMLIGLSAKHGILIVEFANQLRKEGMAFEEAIITAAKLRLRPIIMTGISTVIGAVPLMLATGAGAACRQNIGIVQVYGGISGILLTLIIIPVGYVYFCSRNLFQLLHRN
ncbi:MAG: efflux RND transporter permease subunit [Holosporaceae bacterium]|jgi:multidrug efflux pump|nr:efflux RND transporter permease subunit [Holosporaceae bacterium]